MPLYNCGSVEIVEPTGLDSLSLSNLRQNGSEYVVDYDIEGGFGDLTEIVVEGEISDRDNVAGRGFQSDTLEVVGSPVSGTLRIDIEERPTETTGWFSDTLPTEVNVEVTAGGETLSESIDIEIVPEALERLEITNAEQDGSKVVVDFEVGGGSGFNIGEDEAGNIGEVQVKNPVPWADGTESWIPGLTESGAAQLLPNPTSLNLGTYNDGLTLQGGTTTATIEIPLGLTPPESFGPVESFVGIGVTTENDTQLIGTYDITIDPVAWIDDVDVSCTLNETEVDAGESATLDVRFENNAGPAAFGTTVEMDLLYRVFVNGVRGDESSVTVKRGEREEDGVVRVDFRGPRGVGSNEDGDVFTAQFEITADEGGSYDIEVFYEADSASRIIPTDEIL